MEYLVVFASRESDCCVGKVRSGACFSLSLPDNLALNDVDETDM